ncbi:MAG: hypothetical protein MJ206_01110 [Bacilli bacterium]|nr:hypothetical protein [Bacilli bacterium]
MAKNVKFYDGHTVQEWQKKYQKQIAKGKIKVFEREEDLLNYAKYWKIDGKYYQIPMAFEWYAKSLRKSKGLTIALTVTSTLATFFLCAALIQSQIKWEEDQGFTVSLYAGDGVFKEGSKSTKSKVIHGVKKGTKLNEIKDYAIPWKEHSETEEYGFSEWHIDDEDEAVFPKDKAIDSNVSLKANYEMVPSDPVDFKSDSWATVYSVIEKGKQAFIDTYCSDQLSYIEGAEDNEQALYEFMDSTNNWKTFSVGNVGDYGVRLIGVGQDKLAEGEEEIKRELFTFEFNECVQQVSYSYTQAGSPFYTAAGAENEEATRGNDYCYLKKYYDSDLLPQFPKFLQDRIKTVEKRTLEIHGGFAYHSSLNDPDKKQYESWIFDRDECLDKQDKHLEMAVTKEKLFSLSIDEIGGDYISFDESLIEGWSETSNELIGMTTQADEQYLEYYKDESRGITSQGEGFERSVENGNDRRGAYMFYQNEWEDTEGHNYEHKREKKYFIGDDPTGVETQYRLRSIYIPYEYDVDDFATGRMGGNKDYRPFETWNINPDGSIGNCKVSGTETTPGSGKKWHFLAGDMAWAGIYVAPAFCL